MKLVSTGPMLKSLITLHYITEHMVTLKNIIVSSDATVSS